ncbi:MAG: hypothetical protein F4Y18_00940 [Cenarchaeum sp. SB0663_bin_5]|nr:hypothetical protein [Cenarchaeum sp. SB0663_bin_5]MYH04715.1 hypothetical protein [Cenarchaeum sp. SB0675_bin_21]
MFAVQRFLPQSRAVALNGPDPGRSPARTWHAGPPGCILGRFFVKSRRNGADEGQKSTHVRGCLDVEGSCVNSPEKRQAQTGERDASCIVALWSDV